MAKPSTPIPPDKIGENFAWRDWFQRLSDKVFGSMSSQDSNAVNITGGTINGTSIGATTASTGHFTSAIIDTPLAVAYGGLGIATVPSNGYVPIGNGTKYVAAALTASSGITISNTAGASAIASTAGGGSAPITKTADFTVGTGEYWFINNKSTSTCTVTLPTASSWTGRELSFINMQAQTLVSASSNVVPIDSTSAGTAILLGVVGNWATLVSDGTNWVIMQAAANNNLLLE